MSDPELAVVSVDSFATPTIITRAGPSTRKKFFEFFTVPIRNANTRAAYYRAIQQFEGNTPAFVDGEVQTLLNSIDILTHVG